MESDHLCSLLEEGRPRRQPPITAGVAGDAPRLVPKPKSSAATAPAWGRAAVREDDETWIQIGYVFYLGTAVALLFLIRPHLPAGLDRWMLMAFAAVWGLGSVGLTVGMFGTSRFEKNCSRHIGRFIGMCFSLLVIYAVYLLTLRVDGTPTSAPSPSSSSLGADDLVRTGYGDDAFWAVRYGAIGAFVLAGHIYSWIMASR